MSGEMYRLKMRVAHRFGYCWPEPTPVEPGNVWCHWCGMRGKLPPTRAEAERAMFSAGVSVDAPHATSVDGDASHTSTAPAEPPQPTRPDPGITERKPRR